MTEGFIFNGNLCVGCGACKAACILENGWSFYPRSVYTINSEAYVSLPLINISLACNHCKEAACLNGCPSGSYFRDPLSGAVVIDDNKCIGCRYCQWNCPYDAPKYDKMNRIIGKCNLCFSGFTEGRLPACTTSCPTGALKYGKLDDGKVKEYPAWFPDKNLSPLVEFPENIDFIPLRIIPENKSEIETIIPKTDSRSLAEDWSLLLFSFLTTISVSLLVSSVINGTFMKVTSFAAIIFLAGIISIFHTGRILRIWRTVRKLRTSPLSREIGGFIIYVSVGLTAVILESPALLVAASALGLILLILIDSVYIYSDNRKYVLTHSGQTFLSSLLIISFITGSIIPFIFIALIKVASTLYNWTLKRIKVTGFGLRYLRLALLVVTGTSLVTGISFPDPVIIILFIGGEFLDRVFFYLDFKPLNINTLIHNHLIIGKDEKKRG
jgi:anaerobic dimethyl sulfoxide reductase subunit B (iron-sulfur subunit)